MSSPRVNILTVNPFDLRKEAMYPREIGGEAGAKGFISIRRTFTDLMYRKERVRVKWKIDVALDQERVINKAILL